MAERVFPPCPAYLVGNLARRWEDLAPELWKIGTLDDLNADLLAKYILDENSYLKVSANVQEAIASGNAESAAKWLTAQDRLTKQILALGAELGITPKARRMRGAIRK